MLPIDDEDAFADDFVNLAGWGGQETAGNNKNLKLVNFQVTPKRLCDRIHSIDNIRSSFSNDREANNLVKKLNNLLPWGFTSDIICVGHDFDKDQSKLVYHS